MRFPLGQTALAELSPEMQDELIAAEIRRKEEETAAAAEDARLRQQAQQLWNEAVMKAQARLESPRFAPIAAEETPEQYAARAELQRNPPEGWKPVEYNPVVEEAPWKGDKNLIVRGNYSDFVRNQQAGGQMPVVAPMTNIDSPEIIAAEKAALFNDLMTQRMGGGGMRPTTAVPTAPAPRAFAVGGSVAEYDPASRQLTLHPVPKTQTPVTVRTLPTGDRIAEYGDGKYMKLSKEEDYTKDELATLIELRTAEGKAMAAGDRESVVNIGKQIEMFKRRTKKGKAERGIGTEDLSQPRFTPTATGTNALPRVGLRILNITQRK